MLDSAAGGAFMTKTVNEAKAILENMLQNFSQWHTERAPSSGRKVNSVKKVNSLTAKVDAIYSYISKQNVDNVPLQYLVENNSENIDINYIRNFGNNGYNNNYNNQYDKPPYVPNKYTSGNKISNYLDNTMRSFLSTQKELKKKFIAKFERFDALNEKVDHMTREIVAIKNHMQEKCKRKRMKNLSNMCKI
jgi:DNA-directed RNA polymerase subunit F